MPRRSIARGRSGATRTRQRIVPLNEPPTATPVTSPVPRYATAHAFPSLAVYTRSQVSAPGLQARRSFASPDQAGLRLPRPAMAEGRRV